MTSSSRFPRGSVVLTPWPSPDGLLTKARPAIVIQNPAIRTEFDHIALVPLSGRIRRYDHTLSDQRYLLVPDTAEYHAMGLRTTSVIMADRIQSVERQFMLETIGRCPEPVMSWVDRSLIHVLGLSEAALAMFRLARRTDG